MCGSCKTPFCDRKCQVSAWNTHKIFCSADPQKLINLIKDDANFVSISSAFYGLVNAIVSDKQYEDTVVDDMIDSLRHGTLVRLDTDDSATRVRFLVQFNIGTDMAVQHTDAVLFEKQKKLMGLECAVLNSTGCISLRGALLVLAANRNTGLPSNETFAAFVWLSKMLNASTARLFECVPQGVLSIDPDMSFQPDLPGCSYSLNIGEVETVGRYIGTNLFSEHERVVAYLIMFDPSSASSASPKDIFGFSDELKIPLDADDDTFAAKMRENQLGLWHEVTRRRPSTQHTLILLRVGDFCFIVQTYYGYYGVQQWLDFDSPLVLAQPLPPVLPENSTWRQTMDSQPKFRGLMNKAHGLRFCNALHRLATRVQTKDYAAITGIKLAECLLPKKFYMRVIKLNLNKLCLTDQK